MFEEVSRAKLAGVREGWFIAKVVSVSGRRTSKQPELPETQ